MKLSHDKIPQSGTPKRGPKGDAGPSGEKGSKGDQGAIGPKGAKGSVGKKVKLLNYGSVLGDPFLHLSSTSPNPPRLKTIDMLI